MYYPFQTKLLDLKKLNYSIMKAFYTLLILLIPFVGYGQETNIQSNYNSYVISQQIENQNLFTKQIFFGKTLSLVGIVTTILGGATSTPEITYVGGGLSLIGFTFEMDSYKWLKKNKIRLKKPKLSTDYLNKYKVYSDGDELVLKFLEIDFKQGDNIIIEYSNPKIPNKECTIISVNQDNLEVRDIYSKVYVGYSKIFRIVKLMSSFNKTK